MYTVFYRLIIVFVYLYISSVIGYKVFEEISLHHFRQGRDNNENNDNRTDTSNIFCVFPLGQHYLYQYAKTYHSDDTYQPRARLNHPHIESIDNQHDRQQKHKSDADKRYYEQRQISRYSVQHFTEFAIANRFYNTACKF